MFHQSHWARAGGLVSYGFNFDSMWRRGAEMVAALLRGAKAAETPMETPVSFELALNLNTARILGVTVPQAMLIRADRVFGAT
jgi:putative ABC transport system substrate-binding protein